MVGIAGRLRSRHRRRLTGFGIAAVLLVLFLSVRTPDTDPVAMRRKYAAPGDRFLPVGDGLVIRVRDTGPRTAPPLMLLHGAESSLETWTPWAMRLDRRFRVIRFDLPGHGLTGIGRTPSFSPATLSSVVDQVRARLGVGRMVLAGSSYGGGIAWRYALDHPDRLAGLVLIDSSGGLDPGHGPVPLAFRVLRTPGLRNLAAAITPRRFVEGGVRSAFFDQRKVAQATIDRTWEMIRYPGNRQAMIARASASPVSASSRLLRSIKTPTLILWGAQDAGLPVRTAYFFADAIPNSRVIIYPDTGHLPMEERADESAADTARFAERVTR